MDSSRPDRLTALQRDLLTAFFARERRWFLTGGAALAGFYFGHRGTEGLDFFSPPGPLLEEAAGALRGAAESLGGTVEAAITSPDFRRCIVHRGDETCIVALVIDRAPMVDRDKLERGVVRIDTLREISANKLCTVLGRAELKDLVDLKLLLPEGTDLSRALADAESKDAGADPATLAWLLREISIGPRAVLPGGVDPVELDAFRRDLVRRLDEIAFERARK